MAVKSPLVVLLGASGFVGSAVLRELAARPGRVRAVSRRPAAVPDDARAEVEVLAVDLCEPGRLAEAVAGADVVIHAVAYIAGSTTWRVADGDSAAERVTVGLVRDLIEAVRRSDPPVHVVFTGAASQVGPADREVLDGTETDRPAGSTTGRSWPPSGPCWPPTNRASSGQPRSGCRRSSAPAPAPPPGTRAWCR
ncbi:hypothetical protein GCM10027605_55690 [Micromonospora zhanjiangensis]